MNRVFVVLLILTISLLCGCNLGATRYNPGYTGYSGQGYTISYGYYGPYYWTPRYYYYRGYNDGWYDEVKP